nr:uncharacterized protein LOC104112227 isoform X2 [Nicotiana tomentosiformis]
MAAKNLAFTFLILVLVATPLPGMAVYVTPKNVTCHDVINYFAYCQEYVDGDYDDPTPACCDNLHIMNENVKKDNTEARSFPISEHMDCTNV